MKIIDKILRKFGYTKRTSYAKTKTLANDLRRVFAELTDKQEFNLWKDEIDTDMLEATIVERLWEGDSDDI